MEAAHLIAFNLALLAAIASPGPSMLFLMKTTLNGGRRVGLYCATGLATMAALWTLMALLGLDSLFLICPWTYVVLKAAGAIYLLWIAWHAWTHANTPLTAAPAPSRSHAFLSGFLVNLGNPKSIIFAAAVIVVIFPPDMTLANKLLIFADHLGVELLVQSALVFLLSGTAVSRRYLKARPILDRISAVVLGGLGLRILLNR